MISMKESYQPTYLPFREISTNLLKWLQAEWPIKSRHMSTKVAQRWPLQKLHKNEGDLGEVIIAAGFEKLPKVR